MPSREQFCDLSPAIAKQAVSLIDDEVLLSRPRRLLNAGIEVVVPALSALLPQSAFQVLGYQRPLFVAIKIHKLYNLEDKKEKKKKRSPACFYSQHIYSIHTSELPTFSSSSLVQGPFTNSGSKTLNQRC